MYNVLEKNIEKNAYFNIASFFDLKDQYRDIIAIKIDNLFHLKHFYGEDILLCALKILESKFKKNNFSLYFIKNNILVLVSTKKNIEEIDKEIVEDILNDSIEIDENLVIYFSSINRLIKGNHKNIYKSIGFYLFDKPFNLKNSYINYFEILDLIVQAIKNPDLIIIEFQPIYDNKKQKISHYESLVRIKDKDGKIYYPDSFLDIAIHSGRYLLLSSIIIKKVFAKIETIDSGIKLSINVDFNDLCDKNILNLIYKLLKKSSRPNCIIFEILETSVLEKFCEIEDFLKKIKEYGAMLALDDFGSGYSNFAIINQINFDYIKIDGSLICKIINDEKMLIALKNIVNIAKTFDAKIIAEYVENEEIYNIITKIGIDYSQGWFIGKPNSKLLPLTYGILNNNKNILKDCG